MQLFHVQIALTGIQECLFTEDEALTFMKELSLEAATRERVS